MKEDGSGEDFQEDSSRGKENQKTPPEVKQQSKDSRGSNPDGEELFSLNKKEMRAEVQRMIAEVGDITGCVMIRGKPYPEWTEQESYPPSFKRPDVLTFDEKGVARQHLWRFSIRTGGLLHMEA